MAFLPRGAALENAWAKQLQEEGVKAHAENLRLTATGNARLAAAESLSGAAGAADMLP
jgi:hypothetical protein